MRKVIQIDSNVHSDSARNIKTPLLEFVRYTEVKRLVHQVATEQRKRKLKTLAVLSLLPGEGKTFFVSSLALGYALLLKKKVLIVDATSQTLNGYLFVDRVVGHSDGEGGETETHTPMLEVVDLMSTHNKEGQTGETAEFLLGPVVESHREQYDLIILDTSALDKKNKNNMDPVIVASQADASILLTSPRSTDRESMDKVRKAVNGWNIELLGAVFNEGVHK